MRVLVATDAWHPQVNGVVRTLYRWLRQAREASASMSNSCRARVLVAAMPTYPELAARDPRPRARSPGASRPASPMPSISRPKARSAHGRAPIASSGGLPFTTCYHDAFSRIYRGALSPIPELWSYAALRALPQRRDSDDGVHPVARCRAQAARLREPRACGRAASTPICSRRTVPLDLDLPRPIFMSVGRVAIEKNLEAFLSLDLPGTKVVIGDGPQEDELKRRFPDAHFLGSRAGKRWPPTSRRPTSSSSRASPTRSGSCSSKRWPAECRSRRFR